ncbi:MAG: Mur ligase family protein [Acidobacteriota bacterium]
MEPESLDIYLIAIGGTGMAPLACLLRDLGHRVRGVDGPLYPPMSTLLADAGVEPLVGYDQGHLAAARDAGEAPDLVIVGNAVPRHNPEAQAAEALAAEADGVERISMPQALARFVLAGRDPLVAAGTHGKTTTTSMAAWVYRSCGEDPGWLVGGIPKNLGPSFHIGGGRRFVIEGDEYNAAYFDRGPKFLHYAPNALILTSVEYDHADLYPTHDAMLDAYSRLVELVPEDGLVAAYGDSPQVREVASRAKAPVVFYGLGPGNDVRPKDGVEWGEGGSRCVVLSGDPERDAEAEMPLHLAAPGEHNLLNALAVWAVARHDGLPAAAVATALGAFSGAKRRLEELGTEAGITVVDDFAHHPTAVGKSLGGLRQRYPGRRIVVLFEPRSLTAGRSFFFESYLDAFAEADVVRFAPIFYSERLGDEERLDLDALVAGLVARGVTAEIATDIGDLEARTLGDARPGDVLATMTSGSFEGLPHRLLDRLRSRAPST